MILNEKHSLTACCTGYIIQAIVNTLTPLLYATFNTSLNIPMQLIALIATINFSVQILTDLVSPLILKLFGLRNSCLLAHALSFIGLICLGILPDFIDPFLGIVVATILMAIGGGLLEVFVSPIIQAIPSDGKESRMMILHSFYCWGQCFVVLFSTLFFILFGIENWKYLAFTLTLIPLLNFIFFTKIPIYNLDEEIKTDNRNVFKNPLFYLIILIMLCSGAAELAVSTWISYFAEIGLNIDKSLGDILGLCLFAVFMGTGRLTFSFVVKKISVERCLLISSFLCIIFYAITIFVPSPFIALISSALCGLSVAALWPGTYSLGAEKLKDGGNLMFSLFAFGGDMGCVLSSFIVGFVSDAVESGKITFFNGFLPSNGINIRAGLLIASVFTVIGFIGYIFFYLKAKKQ